MKKYIVHAPLIAVIISVVVMIGSSCNGSKARSANENAPNGETVKYLAQFKPFFDTAFTKESLPVEDSVKAYIIIPGTGCPGCISTGENMLLTFLRNKYPVRFVLTGLVSYKILKLKLGDSIVTNKQVYVDRNNAMAGRVNPAKQVFPMIIYNNPAAHQLENFEYIEPDNPKALQHLFKHIAVKF
jgi:hypothetical protein